MAVQPDRPATYQSMLRAIGAFLDTQPSYYLAVAEVPDGFLVRTHRSAHAPVPTVLHLTRTALGEQLEQLRASKPHQRVVQPRLWSRFPNGHQDFLRALGYELDEASARVILLEELEDGIVLTYCSPQPETGVVRKRLVVLGLPEIEAILNAAFERREGKISSHAEAEPSRRAGECV
jgi:hypothetical protein